MADNNSTTVVGSIGLELVAIVDKFEKQMKEVQKDAGEAADKISETVTGSAGDFGENFKEASEAISETLSKTTESIGGVGESVKGLGGKFGGLASVAIPAITGIISAVVKLADKIVEQVEKAINEVVEKIKTVAKITSTVIGESLKAVGGFTLLPFTVVFDNDIVRSIASSIQQALDPQSLINFGKESTELGSNLAEVQNVVDVVFTSMSENVNAWAENAKKQFGLSTTMAKQYVGLYGSMAKAFGFTEQGAYEMATALAGLAGDVASFYNIDQDLAYTKLKSVFSGETETLKDLGIVMTQSALDAYALANGYNKTVAEMTEAEKVGLRYEFVLSQLESATGDYQRTQESWANQIRYTQLNWQTFMSTVGDSLIKILTPLLKILNKIIEALQKIAEWFSEIVNGIFGDSATQTTGAITENIAAASDETSDLASSATESADALNDVAKATDKIYNKLAKFDELNILGQETATENENIADIVENAITQTAIIPAAVKDAITDTENLFKNEFIQKIVAAVKAGDWHKVGEMLAACLANTLTDIPWKDIKQGAADVAKKISGFINGVMSDKKMWQEVGRTIAEGLNTAILFLVTLFKKIKWKEVGEAFGGALKGFIENFDAGTYGELAAEIINSIVSAFSGMADKIPWGTLGQKAALALDSFFTNLNISPSGDGSSLPETIAKVFNGLIEAGIELMNRETLLYEYDKSGNVIGIRIGSLWEKIGVQIGQSLKTFFKNFKIQNAVTLVKDFLGGIVDTIYYAFSQWDFTEVGTELGESLNDWFEDLEWWANIGTMLNEIANDILDLLISAFKTIDVAKADNALEVLFSELNIPQLILKAIVGRFDTISDSFHDIISQQYDTLSGVITGGAEGLENTAKDSINGVMSNAGKSGISALTDSFSVATVAEHFANVWSGIQEAFGGNNGVGAWFTGIFSNAWDNVKKIFTGNNGSDSIQFSVSDTFKDLLNRLIDGINAVVKIPFDSLSSAISGLRGWEIMGSRPFGWLPEIVAPQIPHLAQGGLVKAPTLALVGDNKGAGSGNPEVVAPLNKLRSMLNTSGDNTQVVALLTKIYELLLAFIGNGGNVYEFVAELEGKTIFKETVRQNDMYMKTHRGHSAFEGAR